MHFPEIKEAFYAKCVILVEGETEYGCIHSFANTLEISLDDYCICVINAQGEETIKHTQKLLEAFGIKSVAIYDGDVRQGIPEAPTTFFTSELCFEIEVVKKLYSLNKQEVIKKIVIDRDPRGLSEVLDLNFIRKPFEKMGCRLEGYISKKLSDISDSDEVEFCNMYSAWLMKKKGILLGRIVGNELSNDQIPNCYSDAIAKAKEIAGNA